MAVGSVAAAIALRAEDPAAAERGQAVAELFGDHLDDARALGAEFNAEVPDDPVVSSPDAVPPGAVPPGAGDPLEWFSEAGGAALAAQSAAGCRADFAHGDTVSMQGWILPLTALQLCGIAAGAS